MFIIEWIIGLSAWLYIIARMPTAAWKAVWTGCSLLVMVVFWACFGTWFASTYVEPEVGKKNDIYYAERDKTRSKCEDLAKQLAVVHKHWSETSDTMNSLIREHAYAESNKENGPPNYEARIDAFVKTIKKDQAESIRICKQRDRLTDEFTKTYGTSDMKPAG